MLKKRALAVSVLVGLLAIVLVSGCASSTPATGAADPNLLIGQTWSATQIGDASGALAPVVAGSSVTAVFTGVAISGNASINDYSSRYVATDKGALSISPATSTKMAGPAPLMTQESNYLKALGNAKTYSVSATQLVFSDSAGKQLVVFAPVKPTSLSGQVWYCNAYNNGKGGIVSLVASSTITIEFKDDGSVGGSSGVNQYGSTYTVDGSRISIDSKISSTMMAGPQNLMDQEQAYLAALPKTTKFAITGNSLTLWSGNTRVADYLLKK